ncbi:uncharacterized protein UHOD_11187 [Ustilago sp. UG-2017b]|nr:uncharacterized protein UHOD_11187 [Ustilago sp. UG-2017b]
MAGSTMSLHYTGSRTALTRTPSKGLKESISCLSLTPLDVMIFGPLQQAFTKEVDKFAGANLSISYYKHLSITSLQRHWAQLKAPPREGSMVHAQLPLRINTVTGMNRSPAVKETPTPSTPEEAKKLLAQMYAIMDQDQEEQQALLASNHRQGRIWMKKVGISCHRPGYYTKAAYQGYLQHEKSRLRRIQEQGLERARSKQKAKSKQAIKRTCQSS